MSGWAYGLWENARNGERALLHNGGGKGYRALAYLLPQQDAGFFIAYNLADRHEEGELQEVFITQFRNRFVRGQQIVNTSSPESVPTAPLAGDYVYVRRARTTEEKLIATVNRVRITAGEGNLMIAGARGDRVSLIPIGGRFADSSVTGCLAVAALVLVARPPLGAEASVALRVWRWLIVIALLAFVMLAWYGTGGCCSCQFSRTKNKEQRTKNGTENRGTRNQRD